MTVQWGLYGPFTLRPDQSNTIMFQGRCVGTTIAEALNATFSARAPTPAPALQSPSQWTAAETEVRDIMVRTCLINMPVYVVWLDPRGSLQGPIRAWTDPSWPQGSSFRGRTGQSRPLDTGRLGYMQKLSKGRLLAESSTPKILTGYLGSAKTYKGNTIFHSLLGSPPYI
jgi:hypothetical protein